ncbi:hypothetical protein RD792_009658 [Penstemon davidsonii]|uniref:Cytochrome P450 n=1 Tax=Penstemon davidsonii TaxID=160366 RepID=A0ABR0CZN7_9LAMI|nr:hypothetical protein RD792_009658 [Penstemon davidsonii]
MIVISSARTAKEALKHNDLAFSGWYISSSTIKLSYNNLDIMSSPYTEYWRDMRKMIVLGLFTHQQVNLFRPVREDEVSRMIKEITDQSDKLVNLSEFAKSFSSSIVCRIAFGIRYDEEWSEKTRFDKLLAELQALSLAVYIGDHYPLLGWIDRLLGKTSQLDRVFKDMDSFYQGLIDEHLSPNRPQSMKGDFLDIMIQLREQQRSPNSVRIDWDNIKALLMNVFIGGIDTTAATITWAMTALIKKPGVLKKVQGEIRGFIGKKGRVDEDDIEKLPYLKAVVKEILRLYPPVPLTLRMTTKKCIVEGYDIEPETLVLVNFWDIGRDPEFWENPYELLPERFLNSSIDFKGQDFGLIPFGTGRRICPGIALGIVEVEVALANLVYAFDWELPNGVTEHDIDMDGLPGVTVHKKNDLLPPVHISWHIC